MKLYPRNRTEILEALVEMCHFEALGAVLIDEMLIKNNLRLTGCSEPNPQQAFLNSLRKGYSDLMEEENYSRE